MRLGHRLEHAVPVLERGARPRRERPFPHGEVAVGHDQLGVDLEAGAEAVARGAGAVRRVEREVARRHLVERETAVGARERLGEVLQLLAPVVGLHGDRRDALGQLERRLDGIGHAPADVGLRDEAVDHDLDRVLVGLGQPDRLGQLAHLAVDARPREPLARELVEQLAVLALAPAHDRRQHLEAGALGQLHDLVDDLVGGLAADRAPAVVAVRVADPGVQHPQVVVHLGDRAHRGPRVARGGLLVDRDRGREPLDEVDVGLLHLPQELPRVGRQRLHVASLALGVDRVEGERGLAGAGQPREHDQAVTGELERDVLEVVLTGAVDDEGVGAHRSSQCKGVRRHARTRGLSSSDGTRPARHATVQGRRRASTARCSSRGSAPPSRPATRAPSPDGTVDRLPRASARPARGPPARPHLPRLGRRHRPPPDHRRTERRLGAPVVARRPAAELPVGSRLEGTAPDLRAGDRGARRGAPAHDAAGHGGMASVVGRRHAHAGRARRQLRRAGRCPRLGHARRRAGRAPVGARGGVGRRRRGRAALPVGRSTSAPARHAGSRARIATSGKPTGAAPIAPSRSPPTGAGEDAWYGAGVALIDLVTGEERPLATSPVQFGWVAGSPSGDRAAVIEAVCSDRVVVCGDLRVIDVGDRHDRARRPRRRRRLVGAVARRRPAAGVRTARAALAGPRGHARERRCAGAVVDRRVGRRALSPQRHALRRRVRGARVVASGARGHRRGRRGRRRAGGGRPAARGPRRRARCDRPPRARCAGPRATGSRSRAC